MAFLIDLTDARFKIPANDAVIEFIRRTNPCAHSDIGGKLIALGRAIAGAQHYCQSYPSLAYVVLHTETQLIFAIAFGMRQVAFRLPPDVMAEGLAQGGTVFSEIGEDWLGINAIGGRRPGAPGYAALRQLCEAACRHATERGSRR